MIRLQFDILFPFFPDKNGLFFRPANHKSRQLDLRHGCSWEVSWAEYDDNDKENGSEPRSRPRLGGETPEWIEVEEKCETNFTVRGEVGSRSDSETENLTEPIDFLRLFFTKALLTEIVKKTNLFARQYLDNIL